MYGARGITIYDQWKDDFKAFYDYVSELPNCRLPGFTLDRINNDQGYYPGNLRWANKHTQTCNSRIRNDNRSGYKGIHFHKDVGKWVSGFRKNGKYTRIGYFKTPEEGYKARIEYLKSHDLLEYLD